MSKVLYLFRHASAESGGGGSVDKNRELTDTGRTHALKMGRTIKDKGELPEGIVCSPATRTKQTAELFAEQVGFDEGVIQEDERIYDGSVRMLMQVIHEMDNQASSQVLVGHNPGITYLTELLSKENINHMPTCGYAKIEFEVDDWAAVSSGSGQLVYLESPESNNL